MAKDGLIFAIALVIAAAGLDLAIGDPRWAPHPVQLMGSVIEKMRQKVEKLAGDNAFALRLGGIFITSILILISGISGWLLERLALPNSPLPRALGSIIVVIFLASTLAARSLRTSVFAVLKALPNNLDNEQLQPARRKLSQIVGRDVWKLNKSEIIRASAETASENSVDGIFAPLFWMFFGAALWNISTALPGPLAFSLIFKASSTIDSMLGYLHGRLKWLGMAGARLDDLLTWLPCRAVLLTLPIVSQPLNKLPTLVIAAWVDGSKYKSPNSGISEAIFGHCARVRMGGENYYQNNLVNKPLIAKDAPAATIESIGKLLELSIKLELFWIASIMLISFSLKIIIIQ